MRLLLWYRYEQKTKSESIDKNQVKNSKTHHEKNQKLSLDIIVTTLDHPKTKKPRKKRLLVNN